jgi:hypothetical protein
LRSSEVELAIKTNENDIFIRYLVLLLVLLF